MENRARYAVIGAFVLACLMAGFGFVYWIGHAGGIGARTLYAVRFEQPVSGLVPGAGVLFNGVRVGAVSAVDLDAADPKRVTALLAVDPATPVRSDTQVDIAFQGLTGAAAVSLRGGSADAGKLVAQNGQPPVIVAGPEVGRSLTEAARATLQKVDGVLDQNAKPLNTAIAGIAAFADMLGKNSQRVEGLIGGLESLTGGGKKENPAVYDLVAARNFTGIAHGMPAQVVVGDVSAVLVYDTQKVMTRTAANTFVPLADAQWPDNLPRLVQARLVQSFENADQLRTVTRPMDQLTPQYRLETTLRAFQILPEPTPHAVVELAVRLVTDKGGVPAAKIFSAEVPAPGMTPPAALAALNKAFTQVAGDIVRWTVTTVADTAQSEPIKKQL